MGPIVAHPVAAARTGFPRQRASTRARTVTRMNQPDPTPAADPTCPELDPEFELDPDVEDGLHQRAMRICPWYTKVGTCGYGCWQEPACEVDEPVNGWEWHDENGKPAPEPPLEVIEELSRGIQAAKKAYELELGRLFLNNGTL